MKFSAESATTGEVLISSNTKAQVFLVNNRRALALELIQECKGCIATTIPSKELRERIKALQQQDTSMTLFQALEILLDYAERELRECDKEEKVSIDYFSLMRTWFSRLLG